MSRADLIALAERDAREMASHYESVASFYRHIGEPDEAKKADKKAAALRARAEGMA